MKKNFKKIALTILPVLELILIPLIFFSGIILFLYRKVGSSRLNGSTKLLKNIGVFPILDHYYEPLFNDKHIIKDLGSTRDLPGIQFNRQNQLSLLGKLNYQSEFSSFICQNENLTGEMAFKFNNGSFESGDAEFLFNFVRYLRPKNIIEVGCGNSTKIIQHALLLNEKEGFEAKHTCIEPYEQPWLSDFPNIQLVREKVENLDSEIFLTLNDGDLLFIDSSHVIRPQGDVLHEYLNIIPNLKKGVFIHIHDIFTPRDYLETWVKKSVRFWNEQYILEALLSDSKNLEVVAALNLLKHEHYDELANVCTYLSADREPGSFYIKKNI